MIERRARRHWRMAALDEAPIVIFVGTSQDARPSSGVTVYLFETFERSAKFASSSSLG